MAKNLVIVESPTKAKTLERYLGKDFSVKASYGHVRDLPSSKIGVDIEKHFQPEYVVPDEKKKAVTALRSAHKRAEELWLATDFDREGEAIAYHLAEVLKVDPEQAKRVTFTEITKEAVQEAFRNPRGIDVRLVEAQQARRVLDRLVGYNLSPLLWKKVRTGLSAGRVQSVALRLIVDREREIEAFKPREYWTVDTKLAPGGDESAFVAHLDQVGDDRVKTPTERKKGIILLEDQAREAAANLERASYQVAEIRKTERKRRPSPPFTTSTLQQESGRKLGFSARKTMRLAQQLYEGIDLPGEGQTGLITYMRTDSTTIAEQALKEITEVVKSQFGDRYSLAKPRRYKTKTRGAQEAHEAVRPTHAARIPDEISAHLNPDQAKLYRLIWQRAMASQMAEAIFDQVSVDIEATTENAPRYVLRATGQTVKFDGFRRVYSEGRDDAADEDAESRLPALEDNQALRFLGVLPEQHFTQPPPRYTEASLVKELESRGIGRPSTYAPTISNLLDRKYVRLEDRRLFPEDVGTVVVDLLIEWFADVMSYDFTARMEDELDDIAEGKIRWAQVVDEFFGPFERDLEKATEQAERPKEDTGETCPKCPEEGRDPPGKLVIKLGRSGRFIACDRWPDCNYSRDLSGQERPEPEPTGESCPRCAEEGRDPPGNLIKRVGRYGPFTGCDRYPECKYVKKEEKKTGVMCPKCAEEGRDPQGELVVKWARRRGGSLFYGCNRYPECDFTVGQKPLPTPCPKCSGLLVEGKDGVKCTNCDYRAEAGLGAGGEGGGPTEAA
ncbi:MAG TPA: type I DNA topoisomerase [Actinomycetota bacterium]|nr:type I DNA topoisomerase [Actinomycetota bacterium]